MSETDNTNPRTSPLDMYKIIKYLHTSDRCYEWYEYSYSYMVTAKYLAEKVKQLENDDAPSKIEAKCFLRPLLFNLRHSIELFLKFLSLITGKQLEQTHDISSLFAYLGKAYNEIDRDSLESASKAFDLPIEAIEGGISFTITEIETIVDKYRHFLFLTDGKVKIDDEKNELCRYPTSTESGHIIDIGRLNKSIGADEILRDLKCLIDFGFMVIITFFRRSDGKLLFES